ncbi:MAG: acetyl-CoA hydrolase/transferase family protein [Hyphomonadaceae bacterium]
MPPRRLTPDEAVIEIAKRAKGERRVFIPGGCAEPLALREAWQKNPQTAADLTFCGVFLPGVNAFDYSSLHESARLDLFLMIPELRDALAKGRASLTPAHYSQVAHLIMAREMSVAILHVSKQDGNKKCAFGLSADFGPTLIGRADYTIALVNAQMPATEEAPRMAINAADAIVEIDEPLATMDTPKPAAGAAAIAKRVAAMVRDDDVIQMGIGRLPTSIVSALKDKERLKIFSGMVSDAVLPLLDAGGIADEPGAITTGAVIGSERLYERMGKEWRLKLMPVQHTHSYSVVSRIENLVAINACLEVDLFGQVNAEFAGAQQIASIGGLGDYVRGARAAPGGRAIVALHAEGKDETSRIVPRLPAGAVTLSRADAPIVVTEHGAVDLDGMDMIARAHALIHIAAPKHRDALEEAWAKIRAKL